MKKDKKKLRIADVLTPPAQTTILCEPRPYLQVEIDEWLDKYERFLQVNWHCAQIYMLLKVNGCRVSEIINLSWKDVLPNGNFYIRAGKKGIDKIGVGGFCQNYLMACRVNQSNPFAGISRFHVYREFKKFGIVYQSVSSTKNSVTHAPRHEFVEAIRAVETDTNKQAKLAGHKNPKNTQLYGKKRKR